MVTYSLWPTQGDTVGAAVAAIILRKERDIVDEFRFAGAISPQSARPIQQIGIDEGIGFRRLRSHEVVRESSPGYYYLDEGVWAAVRRTRHRFLIVVLSVVAILTAGVYVGFLSL